MLTNVHEKQTEQLAKKHGRALNQKSSFTNLLKGKIVRSQRNADDKENDKSHMAAQIKNGQVINQANPIKIKEKTNAVVMISQKSLKPQAHMTNKRRKEINRNTHESSIQTVSEASLYRINEHVSSKITPLNLDFKNTMKLKTFENELLVQADCMTDECYYQQQLEIKVSILKKERDQLWDSINGIVRQNNLLKETLEALSLVKSSAVSQTTQTETKSYISQGHQTVSIEQASQGLQTDIIPKQSTCFQTDTIEHPSVIIQTDMSNGQLQLMQQRYEKAMQERLEVLQFCETLCLQDISEQLSECLNMKEAISEYLGMKIDGLVKQFDSQKTMLNRMYEEYINKFKRNEEYLLERNQSLLIELQQAKSCCKKMQEIAEINERKMEMLQQSNYIMNNELIEAEEEIVQYKKQAELIKESLVSEKAIWEQKKNTYTSLLAASHKTINNLMSQMKEFEGLASYSHSKRLKIEKNEHSIIHDI